jgi:hypothetical protein
VARRVLEFAFRPRVVDLGVDQSGYSVTSVVIEWLTEATAPKSRGDPWTSTRALQSLRAALTSALQKDGFEFAPAGETVPVRAVWLKALRAEFKAAYAPSSDPDPAKRRNALKAALRRAFQDAHDRRLIATQESKDDQIVWEVDEPL